MRTTAVAVDHALRRLFLYLNDLGKQLNVVQMPSPFAFDLPSVGKIDGLIIKDFFCDFLWQSNIEHKSEQFRNERKVITHEIFKVKCDFRVQVKIDGDHESGKLKIVSKNVGGFMVDLFNILAVEMNDQATEEFAKYFIGRPNKWEEIWKRSMLNAGRSMPSAPRPKVEPKYVIQDAPEPESAEKRGLLGSLKSIIKK